MIRSVVIIGSGNLAEALARAVAASPLSLRQVFGRNRDRVAAVAALSGTVGESDPSRLARADIYLIAVSDAAVAEVASSLPIAAAAVVAHTAGSVPVDALARFPRRAVFYPFQTFTKGREVDFSEIPILVETASPDLRGEVEAFARCLSRTVLYADSALRGQVHLAGVFACNFANHLFELGGEVLRTVLARDWNELAILGAVIALRGALTVLLHWEIKNERQEGRLAPDVRTKHE